MSTKKKLITRMALGAGAILAVALLVGGVCLALLHADEERWQDAQKRERQQVVERSRQYLGELAKKVDKLPINPTLVGEIEARYFEERTGGALHVWAMGTGGEFLFGVPKESFSRLNAVYDREITPRLKEGVFFDRQAFLLGHLDAGDDLGLADELTGDGKESAEVWARLRRPEDRSGRTFVLSAPLKTVDGVALGSLYLKREAGQPDWHQRDERKKVVAGRRRRHRGRVLHLPLDPAPHLGLRGRDRARRPAGAALRVPHGPLLSHRPRGVSHLAAGGREGARLPWLRAGGERRVLLPALRPGPLGGLLRDLPLPPEARVGLLPLLPHRDEGPALTAAEAPLGG